MLQAILNIPSASAINYRDADEVCGYQLLLCKIYEREGGLAYPPASNGVTIAIKREGLVWLKEVRKAISELFASSITAKDAGLNLDDMPRILGAYDFFHRVCSGGPCYDFIRDAVIKSADRYVKGDKSISQAQVALMLQKEAKRDVRSMGQRYLTFSGRVISSWVESLEYSGRLTQVSECDSYDILKFLLSNDLLAFGTKRDSKLRWIEAYSISDKELDSLDTNTLWRYIGFNQAADLITGRSLVEQDAHYVALFSRLAARKDLHTFYKEGLSIDLAKYHTA